MSYLMHCYWTLYSYHNKHTSNILPSALSVLMIINVLEFLSVKNRALIIIIVVGNQSHKYWYKTLQLGEWGYVFSTGIYYT